MGIYTQKEISRQNIREKDEACQPVSAEGAIGRVPGCSESTKNWPCFPEQWVKHSQCLLPAIFFRFFCTFSLNIIHTYGEFSGKDILVEILQLWRHLKPLESI